MSVSNARFSFFNVSLLGNFSSTLMGSYPLASGSLILGAVALTGIKLANSLWTHRAQVLEQIRSLSTLNSKTLTHPAASTTAAVASTTIFEELIKKTISEIKTSQEILVIKGIANEKEEIIEVEVPIKLTAAELRIIKAEAGVITAQTFIKDMVSVIIEANKEYTFVSTPKHEGIQETELIFKGREIIFTIRPAAAKTKQIINDKTVVIASLALAVITSLALGIIVAALVHGLLTN